MKCNWPKYNKSLINRGNINFWFSKESLKKWRASHCKKAGRPFKFSDDFIECLIILRYVFHLPLRQLQGFALSLLQMQKRKYLYHTIVAFVKEQKEESSLNIKRKKITDVVFDTSGVRVYEARDGTIDGFF